MLSKAVEPKGEKDLHLQSTRSSKSRTDLSFPKSSRIRKKNEFSSAMQEGKKFVGRYLVIIAKRNKGQTRLGLIASKKLGRANVRNKIKRRLREIFRKNLSANNSICGDHCWDIVVIARKKATLADSNQIATCLLAGLSQINKSLLAQPQVFQSGQSVSADR